MPLTNLSGPATNVIETVRVVTGASYLSRTFDRACNYLTAHEAGFIAGIVYLAVGIVVSRWAGAVIGRMLERQTLDPPVRLLLVKLSRLLIFGISLTCALEVAGFPMTALLSGVGVIGVGLGFGMQGLVSNMLAGLTLIVTHPFRVGEYVSVLGVEGVVSHIDLVSTTLLSGDNSLVMIPNQKIVHEIVRNFGSVRQISLSATVGYETDLTRAQALARSVLDRNPRVLKEPRAGVSIGALQECGITITVNGWTKLGDYGSAQSEISQALVEIFRQNNIEIPLPQREIRVLKNSPETFLSEYGHASR